MSTKRYDNRQNLFKKGTIKYSLINLFLSKTEKTYQIEELDKIEIVLKGAVRRSNDSTRYFIRLIFKNKEQCVFGECITFRTIAEKVLYKLIF